MATSIARLKAILKKPTILRTSEDIKQISISISNIKFFASLKENKSIFHECCAYITYEFFNESDYIFHAGDIGDKFYILLQGEAGVLVPIKNDDIITFKEVLVYKNGASFGELALLDKKPRAASILAKTPCHFAVLDKQNYQRILASIMKKKRLELVEFLQCQELFQSMTKGSLIKLSYCFEEKNFIKDQIIYKEDANIDYLFLIREGEVIISKKVTYKVMDHESTNKYKGQLNKKYSQRAEISILGQGEFLGIYDLDIGKYSNTAVCTSKILILLKISVNDFRKRITTQESKILIDERKKLKEQIHIENMMSIKKVIHEKESSSFRKILVDDKLEGVNNVIISPKALKIPTTSLSASKYMIKPNQEMKPRSSSFLKSHTCSRNNQRNSFMVLDETKAHEEEFSKTIYTNFINRLKPFGRTKSARKKKTSLEMVNIHTQFIHVVSHCKSPTYKSLNFLKRTQLLSYNK
ncbi:hypothetical protein SteCoe_5993 [Stentor coeruleus]|uniref:Cyclic nucleotide-binding domain-containing protein n=1 Tax=Stentor coeruleus TaxID=5963 RepID=A0A1R2AN82_9CILI|nr:hypothetical protein SteCoe_37319 [Stentor coeruleus]OMJ66543.1 hypothetical protein SteCoe_36572 [Stentor coeruleus]OMJ66912.1 hypothetical protein SteCoe_36079 [Stentor coeruleus]OMJ66984.1 hypothetical protein SteCoe_35993 [Stentor coeruleus]OMJ67408.1 hypothetical protein SteCoe_35448 [Stentor coeruleus]